MSPAHSPFYRVCVIGAGAAGLCVARHVSQLDTFTVTVFEQTSHVAGVWVYNQLQDGVRNSNVHSSMYKNLQTNTPKQITAFPDFPFIGEKNVEGGNDPSFVHHTLIRRYLEDYAVHFNLQKLVSFRSRVVNVQKLGSLGRAKNDFQSKKASVTENVDNENSGKWEVVVENTDDSGDVCSTEIFEFDSIVVCNGHYSEPYTPILKELNDFQGQLIHSHLYRDPECFSGKRVLLIGAAVSGCDIALDLYTHADTVYLTYNASNDAKIGNYTLPQNVMRVPGEISKSRERQILIEDCDGNTEQWIDVDVIIFCSGYKYSFPFLRNILENSKNACRLQLKEDGRHVEGLYKHMVCIQDQSLWFIGIPARIIPFPLFDVQVRYMCEYFKGEMRLKTSTEMIENYEFELKRRLERESDPRRYIHRFGSYQWTYMDDLAIEASIESYQPTTKQLYELMSERKVSNFMNYKNEKYTFDEMNQKFILYDETN